MLRCPRRTAHGWAFTTISCVCRWAWKTWPTCGPNWTRPSLRSDDVNSATTSATRSPTSLGIWRRKMELLLVLTQREVLGRYRGSMFGVLWSFFNPLIMLVVYTVAFRDFLHMQWPGLESRSEITLMVFSGMIVHGLFAEVLARAPTVILGNANFVKKLVFPLEVLPGVSVLSSVINAVLSILVLIGFVAVA